MVDNDGHGAWLIWTLGAWLAGSIKRITKHCYTQNIKAGGLMVSENVFMLSNSQWMLSVATHIRRTCTKTNTNNKQHREPQNHYRLRKLLSAITRNWNNQNQNLALKTKQEITKITNSQNTQRKYDQPSGQLFPKRCILSNPNRTINNMNRHKKL